jgi:ribosomal protein L40E
MSLLSGLLDHMPPAIAGADSTNLRSRLEPRPRLVLANPVERTPRLITSPHASAATATPEWRQARDQYLNHIMVCRSCYAPNGRHCTAGAQLRASYDATPMEAHQ